MREKFLQGLRAVLVFCAFSLLLLPAAASAQTFVQVNDAVPANGASVGVPYGAAQTSGNLNVVIVGWNDTVATVSSVTDSKGNTYVRAVGPTVLAAGLTQSIYYAKNIAGAAAGANTVTVQFSTSATYPDIRILEYSGLDVNNPLDSFSAAIGTAVAMDSGAAVTTNANDLLVGANIVLTSTAAAGSGFSNRIITSPDGDIAEDKLLTAIGSYHATATLSNSGGWIMQAVAFKAAGAAPAPTAPGSLTATTISSSQINLGWTASTESGGTIASYLVERCSGAGCSSFVQVSSTPSTTYSDTGLASGTSYNYRVRAQDTGGNLGPYSTTVTAMTAGTAVPTAPGSLAAVAGASGPQVIATQSYIYSISLTSHTTAVFDSTGGDLLVLCASSHAGVTMTPSDTFGNTWTSVAGPTSTSTGFDLRTQVWYARMPVVGPGEEVTMTLSIAQPLVMSIIVVKGSNISSPLDVVSGIGDDAGTQSTAVSSPNITTTAASDLLIGFAKSSIGETWTAGTGFTTQLVASTNYLDAETGFAATPGVYAATFAINAAATWQSAAVAVSPSASAGNPNQVNLTWTASTETGGTIGAYLVERCQGAGCTTFSQIGTTTLLTYNDTNVTAGTSYTYRVRASDAFNIDGPYSNTASVVTAGAPVPTAPTNLTATALSATAVSLSWTASTEAGGTIGSYLVERCQGSGCTSFAQIGTSASTTFADSALTASTIYNYRVRAEDAANNIGPYSATSTVTTQAGPTPTAPTNLNPTVISPVEIDLSWTAATETGGTVASYLVERCQGTACTSFVQVGTTTSVAYRDASLTGSTSYSYRVRAEDTVNNLGPYSSTVSATTSAPILTAPGNLTATTISPVQINLAWTASTETGGTVSSYLIERCTGSGCTAFAQISTSTSTTFANTGLSGSTSYSYRVRATDAGNNLSSYSGTTTSVTSVPTLTAPTSLTATSASSTQINLSWTAATETGGTITSYLVERCQTAGCSNFVQVGTSTTTTYNDTGLTGSNSYSYRVRATDAASNLGPYSSTATASTPAATPSAPSNLTATAASSTQVNLSWTVSTEVGGTISKYLVERCQGTGCTTFAQIGTSTSATYADSGLIGSTVYQYRVRAQDSVGTLGPYSSTAAATTAAPVITAPQSLAATVVSAAQINLSWTAATETGGTIGSYLVERCAGASCTSFAQIGTSTTTTYTDTGLSGSTSYSYRVRAKDTAGNTGPYSTTASATTTAPVISAPGSLAATAASSSQINLAWTASTETGGTIASYLVERCTGAACTSFAQVGTSTTTTYSDTGLTASTSYSYRVRAKDAAGNTGPYSTTASATTPSGGSSGSIAFVQVNSAVPATGATVGVAYTKAQVAGDLNLVIVGWNDTTAMVKSVVDTKGNTYVLATGPVTVSGSLTQSIYYAKNIAGATAGANTVTVTFSTTATYPDIRILEYSGLDTNSPFDGGAGATGTATTTDSGGLTTTNANDLLVGANIVLTSTSAAGTGFTSRVITYPDGDIAEDEVVSAVGTYHATTKLNGAGGWITQVVAFKAAGAAPAPTAPGTLTATTISSSQINLSWTASTESGGTIASYLVERCSGAGCSSFAQVGTSASTSYSDTGLASGTSYSYRVRAQDTASNLGPYSTTVTAMTAGTAVPTAPGSLAAIAGPSGPQVINTQSYIYSALITSHTTAAFDSTGGDMLVLCASSHAGVTMTPSDTFGNSWISVAGPTNTSTGFDLRTQVWYARMPVVGPGEEVTMTLSAAQSLVMSIIVVKGSNAPSPLDVVSLIGDDAGTQSMAVSSPNITTTAASDLLIGFAKSSIGETWTAGTGFTTQLVASTNYLDAETGFAATPGVYAATFAINAAATWQSAVVAVSPSASAGNPNQVNLMWTASTETGGTIGAYLVERCQGVGCTTFSQIGTTTLLTYNDTNVTNGTSYTYRVRASDAFNIDGPYSSSVSVTAK